LGGTIYGADIYAAYKILESFVEAIEAVGPKVCELAVRHQRRANGLRPSEPHTVSEGGTEADGEYWRDRNAKPKHIPGCTCIIVNGEYRSTERGGCPVHSECVCRSSHCGHPASQHHNGVCEVCNRGICWC
jgi:hypothetical protein